MAVEQKGNDVEIQQRDPQPIVSIRATILVAQLGEVMGDRLEALGGYLRQHGAQPAGPPFVRYHTFGDTETDMELGVPLLAPLAGEGRIVASELSGGPAIATWHLGPHDQLGEAYARIAAWLKEHDREPDGPSWEVYHWIDLSPDHAPAPDQGPATWRVQLVQPIK